MEHNWPALGVIAAIACCVYVLDRRMHRRAESVRNSWNCIRCGVALNPMQSSYISVAGGEITTKARACPRCARRDSRVRAFGWVVLLAAFAVTGALLWLQ